MAFVYILKLRNNGYYVGSCRDIQKRLSNHRQGQVNSTKYKLPFIVKYIKETENYLEARKFELRIKSWKKRSSIENLFTFDKDNKASSFAPIV